MKKPIQIFKAGQRTDSNGVTRDFTEAQLRATVAAYDPAKHEAPIVVGHPKHDDPAYGWVKSLSYADGLEAEPQQVDPAFAELFDAGRFKKVSASFYSPDSPSNPVPGVFYLRHVGMLGAQPPAVKGLRNPEFNETEKGVIEFADWDDVQNATLWRRLRDWMIGEKGLTVADSIIPDYAVASLEQAAQAETDDVSTQAAGGSSGGQFSETQTQGDEMSDADKARLATLETENAKLKTEAASFAEAQAKVKTAALHTEHVAFAETLVKAGKVLPVAKLATVALLDNLAAQESVIEFGEGNTKKSATALATYKEMLEALPKIVEFDEISRHSEKATASAYVAPRGYQVDPERMATHLAALDYAEQNKCDYVTAVLAVETT